MPKKFSNLSALDWSDDALIKAYEEGMKEVDGIQTFPKEEKKNSKKKEWKVGDFCRTVYYGDDLTYEAKIIHISDDTCTVEFLGYDEAVEVDLNSLSKSSGKKARKKQQKNVNLAVASNSSTSIDLKDDSSVSQSPVHTHSKKKHHKNRMFHHPTDTTAADNSFHNAYPMIHCNEMPSATMMPPPPPPMPQCSEVAQNPSLCAMITSWYMAGYYTGLHQAQKNKCHQHCCCRTTQNLCHHPH